MCATPWAARGGVSPPGAENWQISEINFSEFPIIVVALSGDAPERTLIRLANEMQDALESLSPVLEAGLAGTATRCWRSSSTRSRWRPTTSPRRT
jgi:multidrug efflux pump subunit AcrB